MDHAEPRGKSNPYLDAIDAIHRKALASPFGDPAQRAALAALHRHRRRWARDLRRLVARGDYPFSPARRYRAHVGGKARWLYQLALNDQVFSRVLANRLGAELETRYPRSLHSYRRGRGVHTALAELTAYLKAHRRQHPEPRNRGIWIFRGDVKSYSDSVDLRPASLLWRDIAAALPATARESGALLRAIENGTRLRYRDDAGEERIPTHGLPTGSPLNPLLGNIHLMPLDRDMEARGGLYLRYGDDILWGSSDRASFDQGVASIEARLGERGLRLNPAKLRRLFWSGSGFRGASRIEYLGASISFGGQISLTEAKRRELRGEILDLAQAVEAWRDRDPVGNAAGDWAEWVIRCFKDFQDGGYTASPRRPALLGFVNDRAALRDLDRLIDRKAAETITGIRGPRAFRTLPPRRLREMGLGSFVNLRNGRRG